MNCGRTSIATGPCWELLNVNDGVGLTALSAGVPAGCTPDRPTLSKYQPFGSPQQSPHSPLVWVRENRSWICWPANLLSETVCGVNEVSSWVPGGPWENTEVQVFPPSADTSTLATSLGLALKPRSKNRLPKVSWLLALASSV